MEKCKPFPDVRFKPEVLRDASSRLECFLEDADRKYLSRALDIDTQQGESWSHDSEDEFFADYRTDHTSSTYGILAGRFRLIVRWDYWRRGTNVTVKAPSRQQVEALFEVFQSNASACKLPALPKEEPTRTPPRLFIGHGHSSQWKDLKDHLHEKHGYDVEAYEIGARAGHAIRDILEDMLTRSSFAVLVMTGEDQDAEGKLRARQNVIHELGLFQGHLGFGRAIVLLEDGTEAFSNIAGINQIRYGKENIKETFGDVLATLRREFGTDTRTTARTVPLPRDGATSG